MGLLSSPVVTSYRLPIVTIGLSLTVFAVFRFVTDRHTDVWTDRIGETKGGRQKVMEVSVLAFM